tara:strand:- start:24223 stop:26100 length:1878 start_codon:yes stop_codon:yes gene_type:complete
MKIKYFLVLSLYFICFFYGVSQDNSLDLKLANSYYLKGDYEKAVMYYNKLSKNQNNLDNIYQYYKSSLLELKEFKSAEKLCKRLQKIYPENLSLLVDLGMIYGFENKESNKIQQFEKSINSINSKSSFQNISNLGLAFQKINDLERALLVYRAGEKFNENNHFIFHDKIALIYNKQGNISAMIDTYLELLDQSERFLSSVQSGLSNSIDFELQLKEKELLRKKIIQKVQKNSKSIVYVQLLAWYYLLNNDYENAFTQVKALDKKLKMDLSELLKLGLTALNNNNYKIAIKCFDEVLLNTKSVERKFKAKNLRLRAIKEKIIFKSQISINELNELKDDYLLTLDQLNQSRNIPSINKRKYELLKELSNIEAYYLNDIFSAKQHLQLAMSLRDINETDLANLKLQFADLLVLDNNVWEASLKYMQIEKQFKNDPLGHKAKFKNAQVYYFVGEFDWCQAQLEVLKASTSKLIANDALALSILITDNYNMDTSATAMKLFAKADMLTLQHKNNEALELYDSIFNNFKNHSLNDEILLRKANIFINLHEYDSAIAHLKTIELDYSESILIDNVLFLVGKIYETKLNNTALAKNYYKKILFEYPGSIYLIDARNRFRKLSGNTNENIIKDI